MAKYKIESYGNRRKNLEGYGFYGYVIDPGEAYLRIDDAFNKLSKDQQEKLLKELPEDKREALLKRLPPTKIAGNAAIQTVRAILEKFSAEGDNISVGESFISENTYRINPDDELSDVSISDKRPTYNVKPDDKLSDISMSDIHLTNKDEKDETLDTTLEEEQQQTPDDKIDFTTKTPSPKELTRGGIEKPGFWHSVKRGAMGGARILLIPAATSIILGCGFFVVLAFLFKVPTAAVLDKIGFKETAKKLISADEVALSQKVALTVFDFVYGGTARDFGAHGRGINEFSRTIIGDTTNVEDKPEIKDKGKPIELKSAINLSNGYELNKKSDSFIFTKNSINPNNDSNRSF